MHSLSAIDSKSQTMPATSTYSSGSSTSVFDRLYSKSTESSRMRKSAVKKECENAGDTSGSNFFKSNNRIPHRSRRRSPLRSKTNQIRSLTDNANSSEVYNRLYSKGTASYNSKRKISTKPRQNKAATATTHSVSNRKP